MGFDDLSKDVGDSIPDPDDDRIWIPDSAKGFLIDALLEAVREPAMDKKLVMDAYREIRHRYETEGVVSGPEPEDEQIPDDVIRNRAAIVLGSIGEEAFSKLLPFVDHKDPKVRRCILAAIKQNGEKAIPFLAALENGEDKRIAEIAGSLLHLMALEEICRMPSEN